MTSGSKAIYLLKIRNKNDSALPLFDAEFGALKSLRRANLMRSIKTTDKICLEMFHIFFFFYWTIFSFFLYSRRICLVRDLIINCVCVQHKKKYQNKKK